MENYNDLRAAALKRVKKKLTQGRYEHTLRVEAEAVRLARHYQADWQKASIAALLHDSAKNYSNDKKMKLVKKYDITSSKAEEANIDLVHAKLGSFIASHKLGITDREILNAIKYHTTGRPSMSLTEKIIYIADFTEPGRKDFPGLKKARELAYTDLNQALIKILMMTLNHCIDRGRVIDTTTEKAYEYYYRIYSQEHPLSN